MRGIIYKDVCLFFKSLNKWVLLLIGAIAALFAVEKGVYAGMMISVELDMLMGVGNILVFELEEKVEWEKYQRTLPLSGGKVVVGKYAAVLVTMLLGAVGAVLLNLVFFAAYGRFEWQTLGLSVLLAVVIPMAWAAISLPLCYWFSHQVAQYSGIPMGFLLFFSLKNFEDGKWSVADLAAISRSLWPYLLMSLLAVVGMFLLSLAVSAAGYLRRN